MPIDLTRRKLLAGAGAAAAGLAAGAITSASEQPSSKQPAEPPFGYCLNTSTIRGSTKTLVERIDIAAEAGYRAIEPLAARDQRIRGTRGQDRRSTKTPRRRRVECRQRDRFFGVDRR